MSSPLKRMPRSEAAWNDYENTDIILSKLISVRD